MTTSNGVPVPLRETTSTLNTRLLLNEYLLDSITHSIREPIPERFVHAKGAGAFGYFEVTHDMSHITKAKIFSGVGKTTPMVARFSPIAPERGGNDLLRGARGFGVRFYSEDGNFDLVGLNTEMFAFKDPVDFAMFTHAMKRNPATHLFDANAQWDFITLRPESVHTFLRIFGDQGVPDGYRFMPGFSVHTYQLANDKGEYYFVRFHFIPDGGVKFLTAEQVRNISSEDADYSIRDLYRAIEGGDYPSWTLSFQILTLDEVKNSETDVFDVTRVLPIEKYPLHPVGKMVLNKNPKNYFAEVEQLALNPSNLVPGILGGVDKIFEIRRMAYRSAQYHRLGVNFNKIRVNCPFRSLTYNRDGEAPVKDNERDIPNYYPNSFHGPVPYIEESKLIQIVENPSYNFDQARDLYENQLSAGEKERLVENILSSLGSVTKFLQEKAVELFTLVSHDLGSRIEQGLLSNVTTYYLHDYKK
ncbi:unnamed protein product [Pieris brassicae]|uniref:Catalase core domain-containing protein n=2 Tax=Pieris brassicae TaxID=7116 RepID=A0A9P0T736_PIEBR|nr:unnamed protein product [Pieris brassicae]